MSGQKKSKGRAPGWPSFPAPLTLPGLLDGLKVAQWWSATELARAQQRQLAWLTQWAATQVSNYANSDWARPAAIDEAGRARTGQPAECPHRAAPRSPSRHGVGVMALPEPGGEGHAHDGEVAPADHEDQREAVMAASALSSAETEVVAVLTAYHAALTAGDPSAPESYVLPDERFLLIEGEHVNQGWADYRDNHLKGELADLAKVRFRLSGFRFQINSGLATVSFSFAILPRTGPERDFGSGRGTAVLLRTDSGWKLQQLHTS